MDLILASQSKGRAALLSSAGYRFRQIPSHTFEPAPIKGENLESHVLALACLKAEAVAQHFPHSLIIGADTALILEHKIIGKPKSLADARRMLAKLGRHPHQISSAACVIIPSKNKGTPPHCIKLVESSIVKLRQWTPTRIHQHVAITHPLAWAGAYAVQDPFSVAIIEYIQGDLAPVIGLPMKALMKVLPQ